MLLKYNIGYSLIKYIRLVSFTFLIFIHFTNLSLFSKISGKLRSIQAIK